MLYMSVEMDGPVRKSARLPQYARASWGARHEKGTNVALIDLGKVLDKAWADKSVPEVLAAPVSALKGVSDRQGDLLEEAFGIKTVADLADLKYVGWAQALAALDAAK